MRLSRWLLAALVLAVLGGAASASLPIPSPPDHRINDYAGALSADERTRLEDKLRSRERESSNQIVVALFRSLQGVPSGLAEARLYRMRVSFGQANPHPCPRLSLDSRAFARLLPLAGIMPV